MKNEAASARGQRSPHRLLILGVSTRAAAESAAAAGFEVTALDVFADLDQHPRVHAVLVPRQGDEPVRAAGLVRASRTLAYDAVAYLSHLDNHPRLVERVAAGRALLGNTPAVLRRVRRPQLVADALRARGCRVPEALLGADARAAVETSAEPTGVPPGFIGPREVGTRWLVKPLRSGGGHRVGGWRPGSIVPRNAYVQRFLRGTPASIVFVAARGESVPLGISRQLVGLPEFGSTGYRYCGNVLSTSTDALFADARSVDGLYQLTRTLAREFGLVGVNGVDVIMQDGVPWAIEINPRWSSSMELVERAYGLSVFGAHAEACLSGALPDFDLAQARRATGAWGKAIVFARHDMLCGDTRQWLKEGSVRDVPHPGESIRSGSPVCTVFAEAATAEHCQAALAARADAIYRQLDKWRCPARATAVDRV
jgi:predicted ATP-grasp superfamily ATP-dependent carboligase